MEKNNQNIKYVICYVPVVAVILYFIENNKTQKLEKHIRYGIILLIAYVILNILISWFFSWVLFLSYIWLSFYLWYKTYIGEDVQINFIDNFFDKSKSNKSDKSTSDKSDEL